ncbi:MAG TPA: hypothetical protein VKU88_01745 [Acidimicrobiales bacterium]|nr:hypothetical protein [Acidimicrobiales bacterium]
MDRLPADAPPGWERRARRHGPLRFSELQPAPLPQPAPELAAWLAGAVDAWWEGSGRPDPYVVVAVSGDLGPLAAGFLHQAPACAPALRYVMVHPFGGCPQPGLALEDPAFLFPPAGPAGMEIDERDPDDPAPPATGVGPLTTFLAGLPAPGALPGGVPAAVVAVQFLSRLPADRFEWRAGRWYEERITAGGDRVSVPSPADPGLPRRAGPQTAPSEACRWLARLLGSVESGTVAVIDEWGPDLPLEQLSRVRSPSEGPCPAPGGLRVVLWAVP